MHALPSNQGYDGFIAFLKAHQVTDVTVLIKMLLQANPASKELHAQVYVLKSWLDEFRPLAADVVWELKKRFDTRFTFNSNAIEGNTLTMSETELVLEKGITVGGKTLLEHLEVIGHKEAIDYIEFLAGQDQTISEREIKEIHHLIMKGADRSEAGSYRTLDVRAAGTGHQYPPHYLVQELMANFISWLNSASANQLTPLQLATEVHYKFVAIHPFRDGNGRTARLLMNLVLLRLGYPVVVINNSSRSIYIDALVYAQEHEHDTSKLLNMVTEACIESLLEYLAVAATAASSTGKAEKFYAEMMGPDASKK